MKAEEKQIEYFVSRIKKLYPSLDVDFSYDEKGNQFSIWHTDPELQFNNDQFLKDIGWLIKEVLYAENIYNFSFGYDHFKAKSRSYSVVYVPVQVYVSGSISKCNVENYDLFNNQTGTIKLAYVPVASCFITEYHQPDVKQYHQVIDANTSFPNVPYPYDKCEGLAAA